MPKDLCNPYLFLCISKLHFTTFLLLPDLFAETMNRIVIVVILSPLQNS